MKQWVKKLVDQLDMDWGSSNGAKKPEGPVLSEERATIVYMLDIYNKNLFEIPKHQVRKVRAKIDTFAKDIVHAQNQESLNDTLFELRQFFSSYRIDEYSFVQNTIDDFKRIIWEFADHLSEEVNSETYAQSDMDKSLAQLREAVESNSVEELRAKSREFIDLYLKSQTTSNERRSKRMETVKKNLSSVKRQLMEANQTMRRDHLTGAHNRRSYDEQIKRYLQLNELDKDPITLVMLDIDFFKKINDNYGHDIGDFILQEAVRMLQESFSREEDFIARLGGEEFAVILPGCDAKAASKIVDDAMAKIRKEVFIHGDHQIRFTVSMGIAQLIPGETADTWYKRADGALYESKSTGRNKYTIAGPTATKKVA
ncbi:GGDEF domain-containing protein [Bdellovibrio svalbardensis]|uniref:diguanylate cyclase n=1 Tax=Bdellovibrio svalbardensis TaxID=2972972 RepID=A0ABT6DL43_9BACT|nr:GGDEF domain-containing protein [Bdellovibrio svalbardensis]MDG0817587.1 GGDEF domain-containing protein [Bdellovibrio svalbardensis]